MTNENTPKNDAEMPGRRRLLKRAVVALPVIATIPSGAALARSSNMIGYKLGNDPDANLTSAAAGNNVLCLDPSASGAVLDPSIKKADLGLYPNPQGVALPPGTYQRDSYKPLAAEACEVGGQFSYKGTSPPTDVMLPPGGIVVSATALSSFAVNLSTNFPSALL